MKILSTILAFIYLINSSGMVVYISKCNILDHSQHVGIMHIVSCCDPDNESHNHNKNLARHSYCTSCNLIHTVSNSKQEHQNIESALCCSLQKVLTLNVENEGFNIISNLFIIPIFIISNDSINTWQIIQKSINAKIKIITYSLPPKIFTHIISYIHIISSIAGDTSNDSDLAIV